MPSSNVGRVKGLDAYETWLAEGNVGTKAEFLESLRGPPGVTPAIDVAAHALPPGVEPTAERSGPDAAPLIDFGIPGVGPRERRVVRGNGEATAFDMPGIPVGASGFVFTLNGLELDADDYSWEVAGGTGHLVVQGFIPLEEDEIRVSFFTGG